MQHAVSREQGVNTANSSGFTGSYAREREDRGLLVFAGNANRALAQAVCHELNVPLGKALVSRFSDGEVQVEIEENVRRQEVFVIQPTSAPTADNFMELLVLVDALKRASAASVTAVIPYFGYARQDRRTRSARVPITAKVAATMIGSVGTDQVLTVDLHADQIQGFFDIPVDNVYSSPVLLADIWRCHGGSDLIVVSPDVGGVARARALAKRLDDADLAIIDKRRPRPNEATVMNIIGDVRDRVCVLVDDIVDTAGTLCAAAAALKKNGARKVVAYCTHPVLSGAAIQNIAGSQLDELVVTDTIALADVARACAKIRQLSVAELLGETIRRIAFGESVSSLYVD
ncbi:MAG: ribose-phosphate diphosphokinase [Proteobacteria bacterium]|nr:ribose-phosphate diphosphokinase [Pseudomonadota bacterium]